MSIGSSYGGSADTFLVSFRPSLVVDVALTTHLAHV